MSHPRPSARRRLKLALVASTSLALTLTATAVTAHATTPSLGAGSPATQISLVANASERRLSRNTSFETGYDGWRSRPTVRLQSSGMSHSGDHAVKLSVSKRGPANLNDAPNSLIKVTKGHRVTASLWVRSTQAQQRVRLKIHETKSGNRRLISSKRVTLPRNSWKRIRVTGRTTRKSSNVDVRLKANRLRPRNSVFVDDIKVRATEASGATLSNGCKMTRRGIPRCGVLLGGTYGSNSDPSSWEQRMGKHLGVRRTFWRPDQVDSAVEVARKDLAHGRLPWISFKLPYSWDGMARGQGNAWARGIAKKLAKLNGPVWIAFHHEPETDGDITKWTRTQEQLAPIVRATAPNVAYTIILTGWHNLYGERQYSLNQLWPDTKVDIAGFDVYNFYGWKTDEPMDIKKDYFEPISAWAKKRNLHWALAETGYTDSAAKVDPDWILRTYNQMKKTDGIAMSYFNTYLNNPSGVNWQLDSSRKQNAFERTMDRAPTM